MSKSIVSENMIQMSTNLNLNIFTLIVNYVKGSFMLSLTYSYLYENLPDYLLYINNYPLNFFVAS